MSSRFACSLSVDPDSQKAEEEALAELEKALGGQPPSIVVAFATHHHGSALESLGPRLLGALSADLVLGCTAESVIGKKREIEGRPGLSLWAAHLPESEVRFFEVTAQNGPDGEPEFSSLPPVEDPETAGLVLLCDPFTFPVDPYLALLNEELAGVPAIGGMASGAAGPGQSLLFTPNGIREAGAIGLVIEGPVSLRPVVSQGCRPVGDPWVITACDRNLIHKLGGRPALEVVMETWNALSPTDRHLFQSAPFVGLAVDATQSTFARGDLLVRGIMGMHQKDRAVAVADFVRRGQTVQLLVRDAASAGEDLRQLLADAAGAGSFGENAAGALVFSCNGRGSRMFSEPDHDVTCIHEGLQANVPVAGFFAAGEIGPIGGRNFLHGFTASVALFGRGPEAN